MRTFKVDLETLGPTIVDRFRISTEVIVEEGFEEEAGTEAKRAIDAFILGYGKPLEEE